MNFWIKTFCSFVPWLLLVAIYFYYPFPDDVAQFFSILPMACFAGWLQVVIYLKFGSKSQLKEPKYKHWE